MKRPLLLIVFFSILTFSVHAQTFFNGARTDYDDFFLTRIGAVVGAGLSGVLGEADRFDSGVVPGVSVGASLDYPLTYDLILHAELSYARKGFTATIGPDRFTQRAHFIDLPLLAKLPLKKMNILAGAQYAFMLSNSYKFSKGFFGQENYTYTGNRSFWSGIIGLGTDINKDLEVSARYALDFKGINVNGKHHLPGYRNQLLQILVNLKIN